MCLKPFKHTKDDGCPNSIAFFFSFKATDVSLVYGLIDIFIAAGNFSTAILQGSSKCSAAGILAAV